MGKLARLLALVMMSLFLSGVGQAQAYDDDDYDYVSRPRVYYAPGGRLPGAYERTHDRTGTLPGARARGYDWDYDYGYGRPSSCGRYHYWNGSYCADARRRPPFKRYYPIYRYVYIYDYYD